MRHLGLRLAAAAFTMAVVLHPSWAHAATPAAAATAPERRFDHVSIVSMGRGSPVILIPGLSSPRATWDGVAADLAKTHRVILVQVNGFGGDAPGANLKPGVLDGIVADLSGYIARERLGRPAVVGHSMGGLVTLMLAKAHPDQVGRLMIVDSLPWYGMLFGPTATVAQVEPQAAAMRAAMAATYGKQDPAAAKAMAARFALTPAARETVAGWIAAADARVSAQAMYEDLTTDLRPAMAGIAAPITMVYPTSSLVPAAVAEPLYRGAYAAAPHVTLVPIADAAHFVMLDQPAAFRAALDQFLAGKDAAAVRH